MIIPFFPPNAGGGVYRPLGFVKFLRKYGWQPTVVTMESKTFWITDEGLLADVPTDCDVHRTKTLSGQYVLSLLRPNKSVSKAPQVRSSRAFGVLRTLGSAVLVPDTYIGWYPFAVRECRRIIAKEKIDAIYSTSPPETSHLVAARLHELTDLPWVADFRDPWMNLYLLPRPTRLHDCLHGRLERKVCSNAAPIVTGAWHLDVLRRKYPQMKRVALIPNGYDPTHIEETLNLAPPSDRFQIVHAGMLTQKRSAVPFLKALRIVIDRVPEMEGTCRVDFFGPRESENDAAAEELRLGGVVSFHNTVSHTEALNIERNSHILLLIKHTNPVYDGIVPGKLYEYIGVRRPILALSPEGEASDIVRRFERGEVAPQDDPDRIADRIEKMYGKHRGGTLETDYNLTPVTEYRRDVLTERLAEYLDTLVDGRG